jgi:hypothetical protein
VDENGAIRAISVRVDGGSPVSLDPKSINESSEWSVSLPISQPGDHTIEVEAVDDRGKTSSKKISLMVADVASVITVPPNQIVEATGPSGALVDYPLPAAQENMRVVGGPDCSPAPKNMFPLGTTKVTCAITFAGGNSVTADFAVSVQDSTAPAIKAPPDVTIKNSGEALTRISLGNPVVSDIVDRNPTVSNDAPVNGFALGTTTVVWTAVDDHGNKATAVQKVTVMAAEEGDSERSSRRSSGGGGGGSSGSGGSSRDRDSSNDSTPPVVTVSPSGGTYRTPQSVTLSSSEPGTIYYTTDGTTPTKASTVYSSPLQVATTTTLKFFAVDTDGNIGDEVTQVYTVEYRSPDPSPGSKKIFATVLPYVNLATQSDIYASHMTATDDSKLHVGLNKGFTDAQLTMVLSLEGMHGVEFFTLAEIEQYAPMLKAKGFDYVSYDLEPGVSYSPQSEVDDPVGSVRKASEIAHANGLLLEVAPSRAITTAYGEQIAPYVDMYHIQSQALQGRPADFESYVKSMSEKLKAANPNLKSVTIQFSTNREAATGMTLQETMAHDWKLCSDYVDGVTVWFANNDSSVSILRTFVDWLDANGR